MTGPEQPDSLSKPVDAVAIVNAVAKQMRITLDPQQVVMTQPIAAYGSYMVPLNLRTAANKQIELGVLVAKKAAERKRSKKSVMGAKSGAA